MQRYRVDECGNLHPSDDGDCVRAMEALAVETELKERIAKLESEVERLSISIENKDAFIAKAKMALQVKASQL